MVDIKKTVLEFRDEANCDFVGLWHIASDVEDDLKSTNQQRIRHYVFKIVEGLMALGVRPGDFDGNSFRFWPGTEAEHLKRIEAEWTAMGKTPNLGQPICWLALRPSGAGEPIWTDGAWSTVG